VIATSETKLVVVISAATVLFACNHREPQAQATSRSDDLSTRFDALVPGLLNEHHVPGVQIAVIDSGEVIWSGSYGIADRETASPVTDSTLFNIGSVSKTIAAWGVMALLKEKPDIDLDSPVGDHLMKWRFPQSDFDARRITVRRLLSHTSGMSILPASESFTYPSTLEETLSKSYGSFGRFRLLHEPGSHFDYNNGNYVLLQLFVEETAGKDFPGYVKRTVLEPLGMKRSTYQPDWNNVASGYDESGFVLEQHLNLNFAASGGLYTTARELGNFVAAMMRSSNGAEPGRGILSPETVNTMFTTSRGTDGRCGLGYKILRVSDALTLVTHDGANPGWRAMFIADPEKGVGIVVLTNSDAGGKIVADIVCTWADRETEIELIGLCDGAEPIPKSQYAEDQ